jgi:hypothetical protein
MAVGCAADVTEECAKTRVKEIPEYKVRDKIMPHKGILTNYA